MREPEEEEDRIPCGTHSAHKNGCILLFPFCPELNEKEGVDSGCGIGISKQRVTLWLPVWFASSMGAAR